MESHSSSFPNSQAAASSHHENMKTKEKVVENESPPKLNIDLNKTPLEFEQNLFNSQSVGASSSDENQPELSKTYDCIYCVKKFPIPQALAGHQNKHKHLRALVRSANPSNPFHGSALNRSVEVRMDSLINKPTSMQSFTSPSRFGHHSNMLQRMRAAYNRRIRMGILQQQTRARKFVRVFPSLTNPNAANNRTNVGGRFGVFPPSATYVSATNNRANVEDPTDLDLTLKL